jgi:hypothetical protein
MSKIKNVVICDFCGAIIHEGGCFQEFGVLKKQTINEYCIIHDLNILGRSCRNCSIKRVKKEDKKKNANIGVCDRCGYPLQEGECFLEYAFFHKQMDHESWTTKVTDVLGRLCLDCRPDREFVESQEFELENP